MGIPAILVTIYAFISKNPRPADFIGIMFSIKYDQRYGAKWSIIEIIRDSQQQSSLKTCLRDRDVVQIKNKIINKSERLVEVPVFYESDGVPGCLPVWNAG